MAQKNYKPYITLELKNYLKITMKNSKILNSKGFIYLYKGKLYFSTLTFRLIFNVPSKLSICTIDTPISKNYINASPTV